MLPLSFVLPWIRRFAQDEQGVITLHNLFLTVTCCALGAIGLDVTHFYAARTELQVAADSAAHSALYLRYSGATAADARSGAIDVVEYGLPADIYGPVLGPTDIVFGRWNAETNTFTPLAANSTAMPSAVEVTTNRAEDNPVGSILFRLVGINEIDVRARAVYIAAGDVCASMQGMFGGGQVSPNSNNTFSSGICVHSQVSASVQNNPTFAAGSYISAPDISSVTCQNKCTGFEEAQRSASYDLSQYYSPLQGATTGPAMLSQVEQVMRLMPTWSWPGISKSINTPTLLGGSLTASVSLMNRVNYVNCNGGNLTLSGTWTRTVLLLNNCKVRAENNLILSDTVLYNTNTDARTSFNFGSGSKAANLVLGNDTDCNGTGAAYLLTRGGFDAPAKMTLNNGTIIARGDVKFAAQFGGADAQARGLSIVAQGKIDTTSNSAFTACPPPPDAPPRLVNFRLAL